MQDTEISIQMPDGRTIAGSLYGDLSVKKAVLYFHGFPGSRKEAVACHKVAYDLGISVLAFDRPGVGGSTKAVDHSFAKFAEDLEIVLQYLEINSFSVLAISGGTPYGLAAASHFGLRVKRCAVVSGLGDISTKALCRDMNKANRALLSLARGLPKVGLSSIGVMAYMWRTFPLTAALWFSAVLPKVDMAVIRKPHVTRALSAGMSEALRPGVKGVLQEFQRLLKPWPQALFDLKSPLKIWHGKLDTYVPPAMASALAEKVVGSKLELVENGGHFMIFEMMESVLRWCVGEEL